MLCENEYRILKERDNEYYKTEEMTSNDSTKLEKNQIIVVSYFHESTGRSDIKDFTNETAAKDWILENWEWLMKSETYETLKELQYILRNKYSVVIETLIIKI